MAFTYLAVWELDLEYQVGWICVAWCVPWYLKLRYRSLVLLADIGPQLFKDTKSLWYAQCGVQGLVGSSQLNILVAPKRIAVFLKEKCL